MRPGARPDVGPPPRFITSEPRLGFGAWAVGGRGWGPTGDAAERESAIRRALERGITFFDTAPTYGDGESERLLGHALRAHRERVAIATKVGPHDDPRASLEGSLRRLASAYVDLIQLHEALGRWEGSLEGLLKLQEEGKALAIGLCTATHLQIARATARAPPPRSAAVDATGPDVSRAPRAAHRATRQATTWGERERLLVERLGGRTPSEAIAAAWTGRGDKPMIAAQVKVFVDQLADEGMAG